MRNFFIILLSLGYLFSPTLLFINGYFEIDLIRNHLESLLNIEKWQFGATALLFAVWWLIAFGLYSKGKSYYLNDLAGILGVAVAMLSLSGMAFWPHKVLVLFFMVSGFLCIYCVSVPVYKWFFRTLKQKEFELALLSASIVALALYVLDGYASIWLNQIFGVSAQYFSFTKPIAMLLILTPWLALISFVLIIVLTIYYSIGNKSQFSKIAIYKSKAQKGNSRIFRVCLRKDNGHNFYSVNKIMACYVILILSMAFGSRATETAVLVASKFDFDAKTPCKESHAANGGIVLDPALNHVLVKVVEDGKTDFIVKACTLE